MKKKILFVLSAILLIALALLSLSSCAKGKLSAPAGLRIDYDTLTLKWSKVVGAYSYEVVINDSDVPINTTANSIPLDHLAPGEHKIKVRALGIDPNKERSKWATLSPSFVRETENGLKYKLINNRTEYEVTSAGSAKGDVIIPDFYRGKPVTSIAQQAFYNNRTITSVTFGKNVKTVGANAFITCKALERVYMENSAVSSIGEYAFQSCKALTTVTLPNTLTAVSPYTFSWCSALSEITLGEGVREIGEYAFSNCENLAALTVKSKIDRICEFAFSDCSALSAIDLSRGIGEIESSAFSGCSSVSSVKFAEGLAEISANAFLDCAKIEEITLPESIAQIGSGAFYGCTALSSINLGKNVTKVGVDAFAGTKLYNDATGILYIDGWAIAAIEKGSITSITDLDEGTYGIADGAFADAPALKTVRLAGIKYVGDGAFNACPELYGVIFDDALLTIGEYAFAGCSKLKSVTVGESLTHLGGYSFLNCSSLLSVALPKTLVSVGPYTFHGTVAHSRAKDVIYVSDWAVGVKTDLVRNLTIGNDEVAVRGIADYFLNDTIAVGAIDIADSVEYIGRSAFSYQLNVSAIKLPKNLKSIGDYAFYQCGMTWFGDEGVTAIPEGTEYIGRSAFNGCTFMVGLIIPKSVKTIGDYAFANCINLGRSQLYPNGDTNFDPLTKEVIINEGVESIGSRAFQNCIGIFDITIPNSVTYLGSHAFYKCEGLKTVTIGTGLTSLPDYTFYKCISLESAAIPDNVTAIGNYAFRGCEALTSLKLGAYTESIGNNSFYGCSSLEKFTLPKTLVSIGNYALRGMSGVDALVIPKSVTSIGKYAFYGMNKATIFCEATLDEINSENYEWNARFNGSYRPVIYGCELSSDGSYVVSFAVGVIQNEAAPLAEFLQARDGYEFLGWSQSPSATEAQYTGSAVTGAPDGTRLYSIWREAVIEDNTADTQATDQTN